MEGPRKQNTGHHAHSCLVLRCDTLNGLRGTLLRHSEFWVRHQASCVSGLPQDLPRPRLTPPPRA